VVCHDTGRLVWAAPGRDRASVEAFLDALGPERRAPIELVSADMAPWIRFPLADQLPHAIRCVDPFHVVALATEALDTTIRLLTRRAYGLHSPDALIALAQLTLSGLCPSLPGR
jgi:transposase